MANLNKVLLIGNLTRDPELKYTQGGTAVCEIGIAVNRTFKKADGSKAEETTFVDCEAWGRTGETISQYMSKGRQIFIEGRIQTRQWEDQSGNTRYTTEIVANNMVMLGRAGDVADDIPAQQSPPDTVAQESGSGGGGGSDDDDLPF